MYVNFIIELKELHGKDVFGDDVEVEAVCRFSHFIFQRLHRLKRFIFIHTKPFYLIKSALILNHVVKRQIKMEELRTNLPQRDCIQPSRKSRYLPISEYQGTIIYVGKAKNLKEECLPTSTGNTNRERRKMLVKNCRYPIYRGEYGRRRAIAGKQSYQEIQASLQRTVERRQDISASACKNEYFPRYSEPGR